MQQPALAGLGLGSTNPARATAEPTSPHRAAGNNIIQTVFPVGLPGSRHKRSTICEGFVAGMIGFGYACICAVCYATIDPTNQAVLLCILACAFPWALGFRLCIPSDGHRERLEANALLVLCCDLGAPGRLPQCTQGKGHVGMGWGG